MGAHVAESHQAGAVAANGERPDGSLIHGLDQSEAAGHFGGVEERQPPPRPDPRFDVGEKAPEGPYESAPVDNQIGAGALGPLPGGPVGHRQVGGYDRVGGGRRATAGYRPRPPDAPAR